MGTVKNALVGAVALATAAASADAAGAFYAHQTLRQLAGCGADAIGSSVPSSIPCVEIEDCPAYRWRGVGTTWS